MKKALFLFILSFFALKSFSKKEWFDKSYRDSVYSNEIYFTQYVEFYDKNLSKSEIKSIAIEKAKLDFCKKLITEISTNSNTSISEVSKFQLDKMMF